MEASTAVAPPPQRVCPKCARISYATGPRCPYCTARFSSGRRVSPGMLAGAVAIVLVGVLVMFFIAGRILEHRVDDRIEEVNKDFDASLNRFREDVKKELDARLPATGTGTGTVPTPTPFPSDTPTPAPTTEGQTTPSPTASPSATATTEASPTETPREEIRP